MKQLMIFLHTDKNFFSFYVLSHSVMSNSLQPHGMQPTKLLCPWDSPDKNTGVGCHALLRDLPKPGVEPRSPTLQVNSLLTEPPGNHFFL